MALPKMTSKRPRERAGDVVERELEPAGDRTGAGVGEEVLRHVHPEDVGGPQRERVLAPRAIRAAHLEHPAAGNGRAEQVVEQAVGPPAVRAFEDVPEAQVRTVAALPEVPIAVGSALALGLVHGKAGRQARPHLCGSIAQARCPSPAKNRAPRTCPLRGGAVASRGAGSPGRGRPCASPITDDRSPEEERMNVIREDRRLTELSEQLAGGAIARREFLRRSAVITGGRRPGSIPSIAWPAPSRPPSSASGSSRGS